MAAADEAWEPPLLSWKRMQLWSVGRRAPAICEIFMGFKAKKLSNLISPINSQQKKKKKGKRRKTREGEDGGDVDDVSEVAPADEPQPPRCSSLQLAGGRLSSRSAMDDVPHRHSISFEPCGRISSQWKLNSDATGSNLKRNSDATASNPKRNSDYMRRNSDASVSNLQRLCTASASPSGGYERVWVLEGGDDGGLDYMLPTREVKLGGRRSDVSAHMGRQDSGMSAQRRSSCSSFSSSSSVASAASTVGKLASRRSSASSESEQRHLSQLVAGNQFLTHLTAAPVPSSAMEHMRPSEGFLLDASVRCRDAELRERIIFFL